MFSSRSNSISNSHRLPSAEGSLYNYRAKSAMKNKGPEIIAISNQEGTRAGTSITHRSNNSQKFYSIENFGENKGWATDRSNISNSGATSATGFSLTLTKITGLKKRPATSLRQRPKTTGVSSQNPRPKQKNDIEEVERSVNRENTLNSLDNIRASILKDIPRMRDMSATVSHSLLKLQEKLKVIDTMHKVDLSRTFRSKFEEELITEAEEIATGGRKPNDMLTIKLMAEERFMINQDGHAQFRVKTENAKFPLEVKIDFLPRDAQYFFEVYVSNTVTAPTLSRHDFRYLDKVFTVDYSGNPSYLYFTISAIIDINIKWVIYPKDEKTIERHSERSKPTKFLEQYKKCLENLKEKRVKDYEFMRYNADEMTRFKEEVNQIRRERSARYKNMARDGRNIMQNNIENVPNLSSGALIMKIRHRSEEASQKIEDVRRKKDDLVNEQRTKKLILLHRSEIRQQARQLHMETVEKNELKRQIQLHWIKILATRNLFHELFMRMKQRRFERFRLLIENLRAIKVQRAYRKYRATKGRNAFERKICQMREALNGATIMFKKVAKKRTQKVLKQHLIEVSEALCIKNRLLTLFTNVVKIQKAYKRFKLMQFFRRVCVMKIINDTCQEVMGESNVIKTTTKKKDPRRTQFYQALRENREFQRFVIKYYLTGRHLQKIETDKNPNARGNKKKTTIKKKKSKPIIKSGKEIQASPKDIKGLKRKTMLINVEEVPSPKTSRSASCSSSSSASDQQDKKETTKKPLVERKLKPQKTNEDEAPNTRSPIRVPSREIFNAFLEKYYKEIVTEALKTKYASYQPYFN